MLTHAPNETPIQEHSAGFGRSEVRKRGDEVTAFPYSNNPISNDKSDQSLANFTCYVIGDRTVVAQDVIRRHGGRVLQAHGWHPFKARRSAVGRRLLSTIPMDKPTVLWIHLDSGQAYAQNRLHHTSANQLAISLSCS